MAYFEKPHDYSLEYVTAYETLIKVDDDLWDMPELDNGEVNEQIEKIHNEINRLIKIVEPKVTEQDKLKFQKWVASNK